MGDRAASGMEVTRTISKVHPSQTRRARRSTARGSLPAETRLRSPAGALDAKRVERSHHHGSSRTEDDAARVFQSRGSAPVAGGTFHRPPHPTRHTLPPAV